MILIADSGSTKTDWRLIDAASKVYESATQGLSPYFQTVDEIVSILKTELLPTFENDVANQKINIFYYGTGCEAESKKDLIREALGTIFPISVIEVHSDMIGAARAVCGVKPGIAAILGTGSNTCYYDGSQRVENVASLGFILGDEGSGAHIGKTFIEAYLNKELPEHLSTKFYEETKLGLTEILDAVYKKPMPNRFLATFTKFIQQNINELFLHDLVTQCFQQFFDKHVCKYSKHKNVPLNCVGSVAFYFSPILNKVATENGVQIGNVLETPIAGLVQYHLSRS